MPILLRAGSDKALGEKRFASGSIEAKIRQMRQRVQERSQEGERSAFLDDLGRNLDEISASLEELRPTSAGEACVSRDDRGDRDTEDDENRGGFSHGHPAHGSGR